MLIGGRRGRVRHHLDVEPTGIQWGPVRGLCELRPPAFPTGSRLEVGSTSRPPTSRCGVCVTVVGTGATPHLTPLGSASTASQWVTTVRAYIALTKPRIIELLLVTTVPTMFLAADGVPSLALVFATLVGGALAAGSANSLNCFVDRDIDGVMSRTGHRPLATHQVSPRSALVFGIVLGVVSLAVMAFVNWLALGLTAFAIAFYVVVYTLGLKRRTASNIVWGGIAGCMPVLIGWAAVTGTLAPAAWLLFLVVFWWTPPHFWALALRFRDDYAAAGVPMLPVVAEPRVVVRRMLGHSAAMVAASIVLWPVAELSWLYLAVAVVIGAVFLAMVVALRSRVVSDLTEDQWKPMRLFHWSITYLTLLFVMVGIDPLLPI